MEKFQEFRDLSKKKLQLADHILTMTYPVVKDPRLLVSSVENLFLAYSYGISSVLSYETLFKRVPPFPDDFNSKFELFRERCRKYGIDEENLKIIKDLKTVIISHKKSPVAFSRHENFVICDANYRTRTISANEVKNYIEKAKLFIKELSTIVSKDEEIFR
jgi:hypothetical protein